MDVCGCENDDLYRAVGRVELLRMKRKCEAICIRFIRVACRGDNRVEFRPPFQRRIPMPVDCVLTPPGPVVTAVPSIKSQHAFLIRILSPVFSTGSSVVKS